MPRARKGAARRQAKERWFKQAKGRRGARSRHWVKAKQAVIRAGIYAYRDRRRTKRDYRSLWIIRLNAALRERGLGYAPFIAALKAANILLNRKMLSELAILDPKAFDLVVEAAKAALPSIVRKPVAA